MNFNKIKVKQKSFAVYVKIIYIKIIKIAETDVLEIEIAFTNK